MVAQIEALAKLHRGGEQNVTVKHVHVHEGGQAVVGVVNHKGKGTGKGWESRTTPCKAAHRDWLCTWRRNAGRGSGPEHPANRRQSQESVGAACMEELLAAAPLEAKETARYQHGLYTYEAIKERRILRAMLRDARALLAEL